ncbi:MAG TPA: sigma-54 dependent transcriptional regulator [Methylomirabilota bacterium]|jgi:DNA-binding NtrC family response regulator|nr:sigma-54 dependent transcriptional regulator [Methylomirabilota bacterium]
MGGRILVVDDEVNIRGALAKILEKAGHTVTAAESGDSALALLHESAFDLIITDLKMVGASGMDVLREVKQRRPDAEVVLLTAFGTIESAVEAMKVGAYDYLAKPVDPERLVHLVAKALDYSALRQEVRQLREQAAVKAAFEHIVGRSLSMRAVYETVRQVSPTTATVLISGESGTGKELVARAIHNRSQRKNGPFVTLNCGALPETLLESELFGYERGAFTGALTTKPGRIEQADSGTLFLDEVGEMSPKTQVDFLRVLESREFRRLGGTKPITVDVRFIAATNKKLEDVVKSGTFREDLFYRLTVVPIALPPLRERPEDIPLLAAAFLKEFCAQYQRAEKSISTAALQALREYAWPGNVRELRNLLERLVVTVPDRVIRPVHLPSTILTGERLERSISIPLGIPLSVVEEQVIRRTLNDVTSHREQAARILGISPRALHYKIRRYRIESESKPGKAEEGDSEPKPGSGTP